MADYLLNPHNQTMLLIILIFGTLAGLGSNYLDPQAGKPSGWQNWRGILLGVLASATVPLLLQILSSDLLNDATSQPHKYLVFGGYCIITALFADRFLRGIGENVLKKLTDLETKVEAAKENADQAMKNSSTDAGETTEEQLEILPTDAEITDEEPAAEGEESESESFNLNQKGARKPPKTTRSAVAPPPPKTTRQPRDLILEALRSQNRRTKTTIAVAKIAGISVAMTEGWLLDLEKSGVAKRFSTADGGVFWTAV